jgi:DNA polymerase/3'-5' exonuclease PolX
LHYENQIRILKGQQKLINIKHNFELKRSAFRKVKEFVRNTDNCLEPLFDAELEELEKMDADEFLER